MVAKHRKPRILFFYLHLSSFVDRDLSILKRHYDVRVGNIDITLKKPIESVRTFLKFMRDMLWCDLTYSWFAIEHAYWAVMFSKIFFKKSLVVVGGYEVAKVPEINYGALLNPIRARKIIWTMNHADLVCAVSEFNRREILRATRDANVKCIHNAVDPDEFVPASYKKAIIVTVGIADRETAIRKGVFDLIEVGNSLPEYEFVIIGRADGDLLAELKSKSKSNVRIIENMPDEELRRTLASAKVYCQLSSYESFGVALIEAMSCNCIPVVTDRGALPEVVGDAGFVVPLGDRHALADAIKKALKDASIEPRRRVVERFSMKKREEELLAAINQLMG